MKRAWILTMTVAAALLLCEFVQAAPKVLKFAPKGGVKMQPMVPAGGFKPMPKSPGPVVKAKPMPKFPKLPGKAPMPPGGFQPVPMPLPNPVPKPMPMPKPPKGKHGHGKHGHGHGKHHARHPNWAEAVPNIHLNIGGGTQTTVIERVPCVAPTPAYTGLHPEPTFIDGRAYYPFPGEGGAWVEYRGRNCYVWEGLLYVQVRRDSVRLRFRRTAIPRDLSEQLELFGPDEISE